MNESKLLRMIYIALFFLVANLAATGYLIFSAGKAAPAAGSTSQKAAEKISKQDATRLAKAVVDDYNANSLDSLYSQFSDVARIQFSKDKLVDTVAKLRSLVGRVEDYAHSHTEIAGAGEGKQYYNIYYKLRLSGGSTTTGEMKLTVLQEDNKLELYGFFINAVQQ